MLEGEQVLCIATRPVGLGISLDRYRAPLGALRINREKEWTTGRARVDSVSAKCVKKWELSPDMKAILRHSQSPALVQSTKKKKKHTHIQRSAAFNKPNRICANAVLLKYSLIESPMKWSTPIGA